MTKEQTDEYILKYKGCVNLSCNNCYYDNKDSNCKNLIIQYREDYFSYKKQNSELDSFIYFYVFILPELKAKKMKEILS